MRCIILLVATIAVSLGPAGYLAAGDDITPEQAKFFEEKVRPLLVTHCYKCHGEEKQKGDLRVDSLHGLLQGGDSGAAIEPGKPDESLLIEAINYDSYEMPPAGKLKSEEIAVLTRWIKIGAPWPGSGDDPLPVVKAEPVFTEEDRAFWSFQPVAEYQPPTLKDDNWSRGAIDRFVLRRLREEKLQPAREASRRALVRRAYFDLHGLPPSPEEVEAFVNDEDPQAYEKLVDRLLESPRYGERWGRHWLDLVRYAESDGYKKDDYRPHAWRYRDYVIRSFNEDKPYNQFVTEQLAGDELNPDDPQALTATAYLRHGIYEYNQRDVRTQWDHMINDVTAVTADVFLGLGMSCARCHDHKFDPILQKDYFRLRAFFEPLAQRDDLPLPMSDPAAWQAYKTKREKWEAATADIRAQIAAIEQPVLDKAGLRQAKKFPPDIRVMLEKPAADRNPLEVQLTAMAERQIVTEKAKVKFETALKGEQKERWQQLKKQLKEFDSLKPAALPPANCVTDVGPVAPPTRIPGKKKMGDIAPGFLTLLEPEPAAIEPVSTATATTGRRTALAKWITRDDNPLSTRVIVNRLWHYHFGQGLVPTPSDFGRLGQPPSHPELLDYLTKQFVKNDWRLKPLHRAMMNSATYRQAAAFEYPQAALMKDPSNRLLWRMPIRRLQAEEVRDAMLAVSGELNLSTGGAPVKTNDPRRTIYTKVLRNTRDPLLHAFDGPDHFESTPTRNRTTTATQALLMINGDWPVSRSAAMARRLKKHSDNTLSQVNRAYQLTYGRNPSAEEAAAAISFLESQRNLVTTPPPAMKAGTLPAVTSGKMAPAIVLSGKTQPPQMTVPGSLIQGDFTVEAVVQLESMFEDASVRTIVSQWTSNNKQRGWSLGVTSKKSAYKPRNLILQLIGDTKSKTLKYEVVASNIHLELHRPYYVAVSVKAAETGANGVTFYVKDLKSNGPVQVSHAKHDVVSKFSDKTPLTIGGRVSTRHNWHGSLSNMRITAAARSQDELLCSVSTGDEPPAPVANLPVVGRWTFEADDLLAGSSKHRRNLQMTAGGAKAPYDEALADLCHVLLNSSEFLYVD